MIYWGCAVWFFLKELGVGAPQSFEDALVLYETAEKDVLTRAMRVHAYLYLCRRRVRRELIVSLTILKKSVWSGSVVRVWMTGFVLLELGKKHVTYTARASP